jgi:hypothetical protein
MLKRTALAAGLLLMTPLGVMAQQPVWLCNINQGTGACAPVSSSAPLSAAITVDGGAIGSTNPLPTTSSLTFNSGTPVSTANPLPVTSWFDPSTIMGASTGTTGAVTGTLAAVPGKVTYICGWHVSAAGGTAAVGPITIATLKGGVSFTYSMSSTAAGTTLGETYSPCLPGNALNTAITVLTTADGTASSVAVNVWGLAK